MSLPGRLSALCLLAAFGVAVGACAKTQAKTPAVTAPPPALNVPTPPPAHVVPVTLDPVEVPPATNDPVVATPPAKPSVTPPPTRPPDRTSPPTAPPPPAAEPPPPVLQTTRNVTELEIQAKIDLDKARRLLARVAFDRLDVDAKEQYLTAQRSITLAEEALKQKNYSTAQQNASKAVTLAEALAKG